MLKNIVIGTAIFMILFYQSPVYAESNAELDFAKEVKSAYLIERDTGKILYAKNADEKLPPASMTKIMTLLLIMEAIDQGKLTLEESIRVSERAASMGGSQVFLEPGEEMSVEDLIKAIAVASGNDASVALAERIAGTEEAFVKQMNEKAKQLNLTDTHFKNSSGLPANEHYSTAHDMAIIAKELLKYEAITEYTSIYEDYLRKGQKNEFWLVNTNKLVRFYPGVDGLKTGYTNEAKYCLTASAKKDDMRVIAVVMGAETAKERNKVISNMLDYAFNHFETKRLFEKGEKITQLKHIKAEQLSYSVVTPESVSMIYKKGEDVADQITTEIEIVDDFKLPLKKGTQIGKVTVKAEQKKLSETPLVLENDMEVASFLTLFKRSFQTIVNPE